MFNALYYHCKQKQVRNAQHKKKGVFTMKKTENTETRKNIYECNAYTVYDVLNKSIDKNIIDFDKYELIFAFASQEVYKIDDIHDVHKANEQVRKNYVCIRDIETKDSVVQLWGWKNKGVVVVELRKRLAKALDVNTLKSFTNCELDKNKNFICKDLQTAVNLVKITFDRLNKNTATATESTATESEKVG